MRRSARDVEVQLRKPGDGQPLDPRLDGRRPDPGGAGNPEQAAIGRPDGPHWLEASPKSRFAGALSPRAQC